MAELMDSAPRPYLPWTVGYRYDSSSFYPGAYSTVAVAANTMYAVPLVPISNVPGGLVGISAIGFRGVADAAGKKCRMALFTMLASGYPGSLIAQSIEKVEDPGVNTNQDDTTFVASVQDLAPIYAVFWGDGAPTVTSFPAGSILGASSSFGGVTNRAWAVGSQAYTAGSSSFPSNFPAGAVPGAVAPVIYVKRGS